MLLLAYPLALAALLVALSARSVALGRREEAGLRVLLALFDAAVCVAGIAGLTDLAEDPVHAAGVSLGHLVGVSLSLGGALYAAGTLAWGGALALALRATGWALMVLALAVPSQLTFGLPLVALLAVLLQRDDRFKRLPKRARARAVARGDR